MIYKARIPEYHDNDPEDANNLNLLIEVLDEHDFIKTFNVTADYSVNFYAREME